MIRINLLPESARAKKRQKQGWLIAGVIVLCLVLGLSGGVHWVLYRQIQRQHAENYQLESDLLSIELKMNALAGAQDRKGALLVEPSVIDALQKSRSDLVDVFEGLSGIIPSGLYLDNFMRERSHLILIGEAESTLALSQFMKQMGEHPSFKKPLRVETQVSPGGGLRFHLSVGGIDAAATE